VVVIEVGVPARLPVAVFEPVWFVHRAAGLRVVFGLVCKLPILVYFVSLVFKPFGLVSLLLVLAFVFPLSALVYLILTSFELSKLVLLAFSLVFSLTVFISVSLWYVLVVSVVIQFGVGWVWVVVDGDMPAMPIWSGTNTNTTTRFNKCELASNPSKSDKISSVMQLRCLDVDRDTSM
jgi:hypothetical protein